jgi:hypothetical protein
MYVSFINKLIVIFSFFGFRVIYMSVHSRRICNAANANESDFSATSDESDFSATNDVGWGIEHRGGHKTLYIKLRVRRY